MLNVVQCGLCDVLKLDLGECYNLLMRYKFRIIWVGVGIFLLGELLYAILLGIQDCTTVTQYSCDLNMIVVPLFVILLSSVIALTKFR